MTAAALMMFAFAVSFVGLRSCRRRQRRPRLASGPGRMNPKFLHAANPGPMTGEGNWTYLIGDRNPVLIDAGVGNASHLDALAAAAPRGPSLVLVTHAHSDHVSGAPAIHARWPGARVHEVPVADPRSGCWLEAARRRCGRGDRRGPACGAAHAGARARSPDLLARGSRTLFVGDMLVQGSTVVIPASHGGSLADYLQSLERMLQLNPARALPAHGPVIDDPSALIHRYVEHRAQREAQVLDALARRRVDGRGDRRRSIPSLTDALVPMARESVLAHLQKLENDRGCRATATAGSSFASAILSVRDQVSGIRTVRWPTWTRLSTSST